MMRTLMVAIFLAATSGSASAVMLEQNGRQIEVPICGGFANILCQNNEWCYYPDDTICGDADQLGWCKPRPEVCTKVYIPVCGCDGETYGNACEAAMAGFDVAYVGACRSQP